jgi:hypothetical protein
MLMRGVLTGTALLASMLLASDSAGQVFPPDPDWLAVRRAGLIVGDSALDTSAAAPGRDLVGNSNEPVMQVFADASYLYFRLRLDGNPRSGGVFSPYGWGCQISADGQASNYELMVLVDGQAQTLRAWRKNPPGDQPADLAATLLASYDGTTAPSFASLVRSLTTGTSDYFLDFAVPLAALGFPPGTTVQLVCGTNANRLPQLNTGVNGDIAGIGNGFAPTWAQVVCDPVPLGCASFPCADGAVCNGTTCVECLDHPDCFDPARPYCFDGSCVECLSTSDCVDVPAPICNLDSHTCSSDVLFEDGFE